MSDEINPISDLIDRNKLNIIAVSLARELCGTNIGEDPNQLSSTRSAMTTLHTIRAVDSIAGILEPLDFQELIATDRQQHPFDGEAEVDLQAVQYLTGFIADERRRLKLDIGQRILNRHSLEVRESVSARIRFEARESVVRHLGLESGNDPEFDGGVLLASLSLLQRFGGRSGRRLIRRGLEVIAEHQDNDGSWRADLIPGDRGVVYVSGLEMAVILANIMIADLSRGSTELLPVIAPTLARCFRTLEAGYLETGPSTYGPQQGGSTLFRGWGNDRVRRTGNVESWTTALALQFLLRLHHVSTALTQIEVLHRIGHMSTPARSERWPDLHPYLPALFVSREELTQRALRALEGVSDPTAGRQIARKLTEGIVEPVLLGPFGRPDTVASFLLFGPPGARKTSLVRAVAAAIDWPLIIISPPDFLIDGIEGFERRAAEIFSALMRLRRAVILFDECEEFFRRRLRIRSPESRTHGAFMTAGMLPRLQELRDKNWCIFAIATNLEIDELDPAVVRRGRLDYRTYVGHPELEVQASYLLGRLTEHGLNDIAAMPQILSALNKYFQYHLADDIRILDGLQGQADLQRKQGNLEQYWDLMSQVRTSRSDLPLVTFQLLDLAAELLRDEPFLSEERIFSALSMSAIETSLPRT